MNRSLRNLMIAFIASVCVSVSVRAQNTFPSTGRVGIYITSPAATLQVKGGARFGTLSNYVNIDSATGNLSFVGTSGYQVGGNKYAFQYSGNPNYGLFFNSSLVQYEFRNSSAAPVFSVNANTGNSVFNSTLKIGAYTLPSTDGSSGQVLTTNGAGTVNWSTVSGGSSQWTTNSSSIYYNGGNVGIGTSTPQAKLDVNGDAHINGLTVGTGGGNLAGNSAFGFLALSSNTGIDNTATGYETLSTNNSGSQNTATGFKSFEINTTGSDNTATGYQALEADTTGSYNTANGASALHANTSGYNNTATGNNALYVNTTGYNNTATGNRALNANTTGYQNTSTGDDALESNTTGNLNTATGDDALQLNTTGTENTATGEAALLSSTTGSNNTAYGEIALYSNTTGSYNTGVGEFADVATGALTNATVLGSGAIVDASNKVRVGNTSVTSIGGQVGWTNFSDGRYKKNIKEDVKGLTFINVLRPVTYTLDLKALNDHYDGIMKNRPDSLKQKLRAEMKESETAGSKIVYNGFIAQEVEAAANKLNYSFSGVDKPATKDGVYGLRYSDFVVPLVKAVQELSKQNDSLTVIVNSLQKQIDDLKAVVLSGNPSSSIASSQINKQTIELSGAATLSQNIPNPFSNSTAISYYLPVNNGNAFLSFYNELGTPLKTVPLSGNGNGTVTLKASDLPSGVYRYTLVADGKIIDSKQMILAR